MFTFASFAQEKKDYEKDPKANERTIGTVTTSFTKQGGGGYNERTTAKTDNLSGVGCFLNVRVTEKSIRVQVVNVSTGEYEGNATIDF